VVICEVFLDHFTVYACNFLFWFLDVKFVFELFECISFIEVFHDLSFVFRLFVL